MKVEQNELNELVVTAKIPKGISPIGKVKVAITDPVALVDTAMEMVDWLGLKNHEDFLIILQKVEGRRKPDRNQGEEIAQP